MLSLKYKEKTSDERDNQRKKEGMKGERGDGLNFPDTTG